MTNQEIVARSEPLLEEALAALELEVVDIEYRKEQGGWVFRVYIDHEEGIDHDKCRRASGVIGDTLEKYDLIPQAYFLEVSSPGLDRVVKKERDFVRFTGYNVKLKTYEPINGQKSFKGILRGMQDGLILLDIDGETVSIPRNETKQVRLVVEL